MDDVRPLTRHRPRSGLDREAIAGQRPVRRVKGWSAGCAGLYPAAGGVAQQYDDVKIGYDNNGDGDILDAGDGIDGKQAAVPGCPLVSPTSHCARGRRARNKKGEQK